MRKVLTISALFIMSLVVLNSCSKYEEGPGFSLRSKKARLENTWKFDKITNLTTGEVKTVAEFFDMDSGDDSLGLDFQIDIKMEFKKDGTGSMIYSMMGLAFNIPSTWVFAGDTGLDVIFDFTQFDDSAEKETMKFEILRLANKELWLKYSETEDGVTQEYQFDMIPAE